MAKNIEKVNSNLEQLNHYLDVLKRDCDSIKSYCFSYNNRLKCYILVNESSDAGLDYIYVGDYETSLAFVRGMSFVIN